MFSFEQPVIMVCTVHTYLMNELILINETIAFYTSNFTNRKRENIFQFYYHQPIQVFYNNITLWHVDKY